MEEKKSQLSTLFGSTTTTENGDFAYTGLNNPLLDILFKTDYYRVHLDELPKLADTPKNKLFAKFIRDPRYGVGCKNIGRELLKMVNATFEEIVMCGRGDDLWKMFENDDVLFTAVLNYIKSEIDSKSESANLLKKWMPRFATHNVVKDEDGKKRKKPFTKEQIHKTVLARRIATHWGFNKQQYNKYVKCDTTEHKLSTHRDDDIKFEQVPSLAAIKYASAFARKETTKERYKKFLEDVKSGKKEIKMATSTVYDIYKNRNKEGFDADLWFDKMEKTPLSIVPIVDTSGSMIGSDDCIGKALAIGHYLAKTSTYCPNQFITFSDRPQLVDIHGSNYNEEIENMCRADWGNSTNMGAVADLLQGLQGEMPDYIIVLSDMQWNCRSHQSVADLDAAWKAKGIKTKIIWWNFRCDTTPFKEESGHIFLSGYSPTLLKFLDANFDGEAFLNKLLEEYAKATNQG